MKALAEQTSGMTVLGELEKTNEKPDKATGQSAKKDNIHRTSREQPETNVRNLKHGSSQLLTDKSKPTTTITEEITIEDQASQVTDNLPKSEDEESSADEGLVQGEQSNPEADLQIMQLERSQSPVNSGEEDGGSDSSEETENSEASPRMKRKRNTMEENYLSGEDIGKKKRKTDTPTRSQSTVDDLKLGEKIALLEQVFDKSTLKEPKGKDIVFWLRKAEREIKANESINKTRLAFMLSELSVNLAILAKATSQYKKDADKLKEITDQLRAYRRDKRETTATSCLEAINSQECLYEPIKVVSEACFSTPPRDYDDTSEGQTIWDSPTPNKQNVLIKVRICSIAKCGYIQKYSSGYNLTAHYNKFHTAKDLAALEGRPKADVSYINMEEFEKLHRKWVTKSAQKTSAKKARIRRSSSAMKTPS